MEKTLSSRQRLNPRRSFLLKAFIAWEVILGSIGVWRGLVLWAERQLLLELGSTFLPMALAIFVTCSILTGFALLAAAWGLWWRREWARRLAQSAIPAYFVLAQVYTWLFVRSGLMWERRWVSLGLALLGVGTSFVLLTWPKPRKWLGLEKR